MLVVPLLGNGNLQEVLRRYLVLFKPRYRLYTNDYSPDLATVIGNFVEAGYPGYLPTLADFNSPAPQPDFPFLYFKGVPILFQPSSALPTPLRMFGYFVTDFLTGNVLWAERFPKRIFFSDPRDKLVIIPKFGALSEFSG